MHQKAIGKILSVLKKKNIKFEVFSRTDLNNNQVVIVFENHE